MQKEIVSIFLAVAVIGLIGFATSEDVTGDAFGRRWSSGSSWGGARNPFSSYRPPVYQTPPAPQQQAQQPAQAQPPKANPDAWATSFVNTMINTVRDGTICKSNCVQALQGNCNNLKAQNYFPPETDCNALLSRHAQPCVQKCETKFPTQLPSSWGWTTPQTKPATAQAPQTQQPAQQQTQQTPQQCTAKCTESGALLYKQCMDQGAGETICQNAGNLQKASCIRKCYGM